MFTAIFRFLLLTLLLACAAGLYAYEDLKRYAREPSAADAKAKIIEIPKGKGFDAVSERLLEAGIIQSPLRFKIIARWYGYDRNLKAGEYQLSPAMSPLEVLEILREGRVHLRKLTVPEGLTLKEIAVLAESAGMGEADEFIRLATDADFVREAGIAAKTLEGYLFPETYHFPSQVNSRMVINTMLKRFRAVFTDEWRKRAEELGMSLHEVVTLASIIEKETGAAHERGLVASVFHNRLEKGMRLQTDPTVIYGIPDFDGNITRKHLRTPTPYNTYVIEGLPPGPIANPGAASLAAALYPETSDFVYFVSRGDGTHHFSKTLKEHNAAVRRYQLK